MKNPLFIPGKPRSKRGIPVAKYTPLKPEDQAKYNAWLAEFGRLDAIRKQYASAARFSCQGTSMTAEGSVIALKEEFAGLVPRQTVVVVASVDIAHNVVLVPQSPFRAPASRWEFSLMPDNGGEVYQVWNHFKRSEGVLFVEGRRLGRLDPVQLEYIQAIYMHTRFSGNDPFKDPELLKRVGAPEQSGPELAQYFNTERRGKVV